METVTVSVPAEMKQEVEDEAEQNHMTISEWFRNAARNELGNQGTTEAGA